MCVRRCYTELVVLGMKFESTIIYIPYYPYTLISVLFYKEKRKMMLSVGTVAPNFTLMDSENKQVRLSDFKGQKAVIYFYPKDDTPGCTKQACAFRDAYDGFVKQNVVVIGISHDNEKSHQMFAKKHSLPFILLADPAAQVINAYDVKGIFGAKRTTYIVDENGLIEKVFAKASPDLNAGEILVHLANKEAVE